MCVFSLLPAHRGSKQKLCDGGRGLLVLLVLSQKWQEAICGSFSLRASLGEGQG